MKAALCACLAVLLLAGAGAARPQPPKDAKVGVLLFSSPQGDANVAALREGLAALGYVEGRNLTTIYRYAEGKPERLPALAAQGLGVFGFVPDSGVFQLAVYFDQTIMFVIVVKDTPEWTGNAR